MPSRLGGLPVDVGPVAGLATKAIVLPATSTPVCVGLVVVSAPRKQLPLISHSWMCGLSRVPLPMLMVGVPRYQ